MHVVQVITAIHDRYLSALPNSRQTLLEIYHWSQAVILFNRRLSSPIQESDFDALWSAAFLMGDIAFASIEASKPEEAWPLKHPEPCDLEWLRMSVGKMAIWDIAKPLRHKSIFHTIADKDKTGHPASAVITSRIFGIPFTFNQLCGLNDLSTAYNNPYYTAVHALAPLLDIECDQSTIGRFLSFVNYMQPEFQGLLERKDPRALLLLAYWYAKVCHSLWWIARRAKLECQAICLYLERYHRNIATHELLQFPRMRCKFVA